MTKTTELTPQTFHERISAIQAAVKVPKDRKNTFGGYNYRNTEDILCAVKPLLSGLVLHITDQVLKVDTRYYMKATAMITDGVHVIQSEGWAREEESKKGMDASQVTGTASSYARKYALNGLLCTDDGVDADALPPEHGTPPAKQQAPPPPKKPNPPVAPPVEPDPEPEDVAKLTDVELAETIIPFGKVSKGKRLGDMPMPVVEAAMNSDLIKDAKGKAVQARMREYHQRAIQKIA